jgi:hypothetical protein
MSVGAFTDKHHQPSEEEITAVMGAGLPVWQGLIEYIREKYPSDEDFKFMYGKNYGWARRFRIGGQFLTSLYPIKGGVNVQVNLSPGAVEKALGMDFGKNVQEAIARAHPYPEGRWLFIPFYPGDQLSDIHRLLSLRVEDKRLMEKAR